MKKLYKFELDWGRQGSLEGLFIADEKAIKELMGKEVDFGEAFGKHSEVSEVMMEDMFTVIDLPKESMKLLEKHLGITWSGYNPLECHIVGEDDDEDS